MNKFEKKPLYRKVNTRTHRVPHIHGGDYRDSRGKDTAFGMRKGVRRGLDYTPLFKFLLSKVGHEWDSVFSEAASRLDKNEPIYWIVSLERDRAQDYVRLGESSYYSGLYVDEQGILQVTNPDVNETTLRPFCKCCTHTFNGIVFEQEYGD
ncbi:hypothetical protein RFM71_004612 [Vibrio parahaemolyticus]|uniref:hypothetical protein n=1 Tax=Vibrio parahaemolyticus TaxID=670 RepID=UPI00111CE806|nr:hypothetical protein [Vibrio parahaemolyticus]ELA3127348.1 hypothetical protein [Vibrio parahaemolyticus]MCG6438252.1 hypothetical protein [Vibrio parahaemolyticus]TOP26743.1 hypothetical protein CGH19_23540 [Vibrio parahaemolyticus]